MSEYIRVASVHQIREGLGTLVTVKGADIALFRYEGMFYAVSNVCSHQHFSKLHEGCQDGLRITCPMHGWTYDLKSGTALNGDGRIATYPVKIEGSDVMVEVPS